LRKAGADVRIEALRYATRSLKGKARFRQTSPIPLLKKTRQVSDLVAKYGRGGTGRRKGHRIPCAYSKQSGFFGKRQPIFSSNLRE
jgi:hypothetical protein